MSKIVIAVLLTASAIFAGCSRAPESSSQKVSPQRLDVEPALVTIYLSGLMVYHQQAGKPGYDVGILPVPPGHGSGHEFSIHNDGVMVQVPDSRSLTLEITPQGEPLPTHAVAVGHDNKRRPDTAAGQWDFDWMVDLDGSEFHGPGLVMTPGVLKPIIHLPGGRIYTEYKSIDLLRWQGQRPNGRESKFGFGSETVGLDLQLKPGQQLVLKDNDRPGSTAQVLVSYSQNSPRHRVRIANVRNPPGDESDFHLYYDLLFKGVKTEDRYDFDANKEPGTLRPFNPHPSVPVRTCCQMECFSVRLVNSPTALN